MKKKITSLIAVVILVTAFCLILTGCRKKSQNELAERVTSTQTTMVETEENITRQTIAETTIPETREPAQETWKMELVESTPENIVVEIFENKDGEKAEVQIGVVDTKETVPDAPDTQATATRPVQPAKPTEPMVTEPNELKPTETKPIQPSSGGTKVEAPGADISYIDYEAMSSEEQLLFYYSFTDADAFFEWYNEAKAEYDVSRGDIVIGDDGVVNLG